MLKFNIHGVSNPVEKKQAECKQYFGFFFWILFSIISLKMWAQKYQCGLVKLVKLGAHMALWIFKLLATLKKHSYLYCNKIF